MTGMETIEASVGCNHDHVRAETAPPIAECLEAIEYHKGIIRLANRAVASPFIAMITTAFFNRFEEGVTAAAEGKSNDADAAFGKAAKESPLLWATLASKALKDGQKREALDMYLQAAEHCKDPKVRSLIWNDCGMIMEQLGDRESATRCFETGLKDDRRCRCAELCLNYAVALGWQDRLEDAMRWANRALWINGSVAGGRFTRALFLLALDRYPEGFDDYEHRWSNPHFASQRLVTGAPQWRGQDVRGRPILLHAEQGAGDTIQMLRYLPLLRERGAVIHICVQPGLRRLVEATGWCEGVYVPGTTQPVPHEFLLPIMSCPHAFRTTIDTIPLAEGYLDVGPRQPIPGRVGICWAGSPDHKQDRYRSMPWSQFRARPELADAKQLVSLQVGPCADDATGVERPPLDNYLETARVMLSLERVVTVDTSVAHLAGAISVPATVLLPRRGPDWRWGLGRVDCPWYHSVWLVRGCGRIARGIGVVSLARG